MIEQRDLIEASFSEENNKLIERYVENQIRELTESTRELFTKKVQRWRRMYRGIPANAKKTWPWENASNLVLELIGTNVDIARAVTLASTFEVDPIFPTELIGDWPSDSTAPDEKVAIEAFLSTAARDNKWLDLYRVFSQIEFDRITKGRVAVKTPWETDVEEQVVGISDGKLITNEFTRYDGPRPEKIRFENFLIPTNYARLADVPFMCHIVEGLSKLDLLERKARGIYDKDAIDKILKQPDRYGPSEGRIQEQQDNDTSNSSSNASDDDMSAQWDLHECWFSFFVNGKKYQIGPYTYHYNTKTIVKRLFNFYPDNDNPFDLGFLGYTEDSLEPFGFCEMLDQFQEGASTLINQDIDNRTLTNTSVLRVGKNCKLDANFSIYPMAQIPGEEGDWDVMRLGNQGNDNINMLSFIIDAARIRAGVDQGYDAPGGATTNPKKGGIVSAMGTFSVMQAGNRRSNINITDFRYLRANLGRRFLKQYAWQGVPEKQLQRFGKKQAEFIKQGLKAVKEGRLDIFVKSATASINREMEKQNDFVLTQLMDRYQQKIAGLLQNISNPMMEQQPMLKRYLMGAIKASNCLLSGMLRNFGKDDISRLLPEGELLDIMKQQELQQKQQQMMQQQQQSGVPQGQSQQQQLPQQGTPDLFGGSNLQQPQAQGASVGIR